jgi:hypothetical protein
MFLLKSTTHEKLSSKNIHEWFEIFSLRKADREDVYITLIVIDHNILKKFRFIGKIGKKDFLGKILKIGDRIL